MSYLINGEAGAGMDATQRTLESLKIDQARLSFRSLGPDELTWQIATKDAAATGAIIPTIGQIVELFHGTTRRFKGHVTSVRVRSRSISVRAEGPWWWMGKTPLTQVQEDATAVTAERASFIFPTQSLATSLGALIDRAIANGVPMAKGTIGTIYDCPRITIAEMSCAAALVEMLRWVPDAVAWFDYSGTTPALNITRRGAMTALDLAVGTDPLEAIDIEPRLDLEVTRTELHFVNRQTGTGLPQWANQSSGTSTPGKRQIITISGPEIVDFLPQDDIQRVPVYFSTTTPARALEMSSVDLQRLVEDHSSAVIKTDSISDPYTTTSNKARFVSGREQYENVSSGTYSSVASAIPSGKTAVILGLDGKQSPPDWLLREFGLVRWFVNDFYAADGNSTTSTPAFNAARRMAIIQAVRPDVMMFSSTNPPLGNGALEYAYFIRQQKGDDLPIWLVNTSLVPANLNTGTLRSSTSASQLQLATGASSTNDFYNGQAVYWTRNGVRYGGIIESYVGSTRVATLKGGAVQSDKAPANGQAYVVAGSFISAATYAFLNPPTGLAGNLQAAQSWVPWEGQVVLVEPAATGANNIARKVNISGTLSEAATMGAMISGIDYDLLNDRTTYELGSPARADFGTLISRIRREPKDNIVYL